MLHMIQIGMDWFPERAGGLNRYYYDLVSRLPGTGVSVRGLVTGSDQVRPQSGGVVETFAAGDAGQRARALGLRRAVKRAVAERRPGVVVTHFAQNTLPILDLVRHVPMVTHFQGPWAAESAAEGQGRLAVRAKRWVETVAYGRARRLIVLSQAFRRRLCADYGVDEARVRVVPGGVEVDRFAIPTSRADARRQLGWPADRPTLLAVRRLVSRMGLENLIDAMAAVRQTVPDALLLIAGRGRLAEQLAGRAAAAGLADHVRLLGYVPDEHLPLAYRAADVSVVPTIALEGFGLIAAESLAAGTPAVVTPVDALPEVVAGLDPGLVTAAATAAALAETLAAVLTGRQRLPDAAACSAYARQTFDWSQIVTRVRDVYQEAAG